MSKAKEASVIGLHLHSIHAKDLAAPAMWLAIDGDAAFLAGAHAAKRPARLAGDGVPESRHPVLCQRRGHDGAPRDGQDLAVYGELDFVRHKRRQIRRPKAETRIPNSRS